jgi:hypothetical protein
MIPYGIFTPGVKQVLRAKKFRIEDPLTEQLVKSLTTKVFYTLAHHKLLDICHDGGAIKVGDEVTILPYRSILNDIRYILKFHGLQDSDFIIQWNGKFEPKGKTKHSMFFVNEKNFNVTDCLDSFVEFEQKVVAALHKIENGFFGAFEEVEAETPVMRSHVDEA